MPSIGNRPTQLARVHGCAMVATQRLCLFLQGLSSVDKGVNELPSCTILT